MQQDINITSNQENILIRKIRNLTPDKIVEVVDFVDFLSQKDQNSRMVQAANKMAEEAFNKVWDNAEDEAYDSL
ncbi:MAG: hypothetical protein PVG39_31810 [Desulfobacteraceae bacterium]|jgi:hypothetical protein